MSSPNELAFDLDDYLGTIGTGPNVTNYAMGQFVFSQGEAANAVHFIRSGEVKVTVVSEQGKEAVVAFLGIGDFFGEACLAGQEQRLATITTLTACAILRLEKAAMLRALREKPDFADRFIHYLLTRTLRVEADLVDQLFNSSEKRLARLLLLLANFGGDGAPRPMLAKISQETLADMIGTTRSRVSFFMNKFRNLGYIDYNSSITVHSSLLNVVLHDQPHLRRDTPLSVRCDDLLD
ncbi:Crp/Fnr family transcriptional regulator [Aestuariivirga sp.]|uniref:Crp/Fnr family transcriptional regulator n=1 Tax=Aestuariivirga sp. TaxID=2650926 RepID=UPI003BAC71C5